jgi:hypothetical protein
VTTTAAATTTPPPTTIETTTHSAEHVDKLTQDLHEYRFLLHNPFRLHRYLVASGSAQFCRSWFSLVGGFIEKMLQPHKAPHRVNRLYCPRNTLVYIGSTHAELMLRLKSDEERRQWNTTVAEGVGAHVPSCDRQRDVVMVNVPVFRDMLLQETQQLIDKSMGQVLKEQDTYDYLTRALELLVKAMQVKGSSGGDSVVLPSLECHFDALFDVFGGTGDGWHDCRQMVVKKTTGTREGQDVKEHGNLEL